MKLWRFATILDYGFDLPARCLTVTALLALRHQPGAAHCRLPTLVAACRAAALR
ncbi:MAG: hypothetical protein ACR2L2_04340 [Acidobacteriota bacterium]